MICMIPASNLRPGDVFSTDGYAVESACIVRDHGEERVSVWARRHDDPCAKTELLALDFPCPIWISED